MNQDILIRNNLIGIDRTNNGNPSKTVLSTVISNITYYGYSLSKDAYDALQTMSDDEIVLWWTLEVEPALQKVTGADKKMDSSVVYKNFPQEVLNMSEAEYWNNQILMYWGLPNNLFTQKEESRPLILEKISLKTLQLANDNSYQNILNGLLNLPNRWTEGQTRDVETLLDMGLDIHLNIPFKENMIHIASLLINKGETSRVELKSAMDVLRLATGLSDGDITLKTNSQFKKFSRKERKFLLGLLSNCTNLEEDFARDKNRWKKLLKNLHPGEYAKVNPTVANVYHKLYNDNVKSFNSKIESKLLVRDQDILQLLSSRPGEFIRRLHVLLSKFGVDAAKAFVDSKVMSKLTAIQLLKIRKYLETINFRRFRVFPPQGNWTKLQVVDNKIVIDEQYTDFIITAINKELVNRLSGTIQSVNLDDRTRNIKLQTNDSDVLPYGRGTTFDIPDNITFIRSASYWKHKAKYGNVWFDNGWLFFDDEWKSVGSCCWTNICFPGTGRMYYHNDDLSDKAALFSGDPTNSKTADGDACQMIDLYLDRLEKAGVRYAVWNILCYSKIKFSEATEVFAALQWGEKAVAGQLFEPSRAQLAFPLTSESYTKYVAYIDIKQRKLVYVDANLKSVVSAANYNCETMQDLMPPFVEYLETLPSVYDLFEHLPRSENGLPVVYDDSNLTLENNTKAYVFKPVKETNSFEQFDLTSVLV